MLITFHNPHNVYNTMGVNTPNANISHWLSNAFCMKWGLALLEVGSDIITPPYDVLMTDVIDG